MRLVSLSLVGAALTFALLTTSACKKSDPAEDTVVAVDGDNVAETYATQAMVGTWTVTSEALSNTDDMDPDEAALVQALAAQIRTEVEFRNDGTSTMRAQVGDAEPKAQEATWAVTKVTRINFEIEMIGEGQETAQVLTMEPLENGTIRMASGDSVLTLVRKDDAAQ